MFTVTYCVILLRYVNVFFTVLFCAVAFTVCYCIYTVICCTLKITVNDIENYSKCTVHCVGSWDIVIVLSRNVLMARRVWRDRTNLDSRKSVILCNNLVITVKSLRYCWFLVGITYANEVFEVSGYVIRLINALLNHRPDVAGNSAVSTLL